MFMLENKNAVLTLLVWTIWILNILNLICEQLLTLQKKRLKQKISCAMMASRLKDLWLEKVWLSSISRSLPEEISENYWELPYCLKGCYRNMSSFFHIFLKFLAKTAPLALFGYISQFTDLLVNFSTLSSELVNCCLCNVFKTELPTMNYNNPWLLLKI